jgi:SsrA-binding protein
MKNGSEPYFRGLAQFIIIRCLILDVGLLSTFVAIFSIMGVKIVTKEIVNRKAKFEYHFLQVFEAGIVLTGTEVKALRLGMANLNDAYCLFDHGNLIVKSMFISEYDHGTIYNHDARRDRRLLLRKPELRKLERRVTEKGLTIVPYRIYFSDRGFAKLEVALAQGKKAFDKRDSIKERDNKRELDRLKKVKL